MSRRWLALGLAVPLILGACGSDEDSGAKEGANVIDITLTDAGCLPRSISTKAGPTTFKVTNDDSAGVSEFEILSGKKILGEVENIIPGVPKSFSLTLKEGSYVTYCPGGESFEKGVLEVAANTSVAPTSPEAMAAVANYLTYVKAEADQLIADVTPFVDAVKAGNIDSAKSQFAKARVHYETIEPIAESFGDLDPLIDAREGDVPDAEWGGFHRIEKALFADNNVSAMGPIADKLLVDAKALRTKIDSVELEPAQIANGAVELLDEMSTSKITGEEDRYSHTDLYDFDANVRGAQEGFIAVEPLLKRADANLASTIEARFTDVLNALQPYKQGDGWVDYSTVTEDQRRALAQKVDALAEPLSQVAALVG